MTGGAAYRCSCYRSAASQPGVKQTWPFCGVCFCGRYWGQSGHGVVRRTCLLMTQSGHGVAEFHRDYPLVQLDPISVNLHHAG
jgi:hypothetical protein